MIEVTWHSEAGTSCAAQCKFYVYHDMTARVKKDITALCRKVTVLATTLSLRNYKT